MPPSQSPLVVQKAAAEARLSKRVNWFFAIGIWSPIAMILRFGGAGDWIYGTGLVYQDLLAHFSLMLPLGALGLMASLGLSGMFLYFGDQGKRGAKKAIVNGTIAYAIDTAASLSTLNPLGIIIHAYCLYRLFEGYQAMKLLDEIYAAEVQSRYPYAQQSTGPAQSGVYPPPPMQS